MTYGLKGASYLYATFKKKYINMEPRLHVVFENYKLLCFTCVVYDF